MKKITKIKKSIDFEEVNLHKAELYVKQNHIKSVSQLVNTMIESVVALSPEVRHSIASYCVDKRQELLNENVGAGEVYRQAELDMQLHEYECLEQYFGDGSITPLQPASTLKTTKLAEGYGEAIYPRDWAELNEDMASKSKYAYVFEGRNGSKYGVGHYIYFGDTPNLTEELESTIISLVKNSTDAAREAFSHQYTGDVLSNGKFDSERLHQWESAFVPAIFMLPVENAKNHMLMYGIDYPYGAHIRRPDGYDFTQEDNIGK